MSEVVSVRVKREILKEIDELVASGTFSSRNEALNFIISEGLKEVNEWRSILNKSKEIGTQLINKRLEDFLQERERY
ncbi:ribbon-helix-helix domain-containing protein [Metallosphaera javensis (ex Sakai et al. 2022)]|uniref:ribbon-helix-helix domain-containing protein n=1 Tax=Metallosphaera javensis (ex Sakai et al. 2022) TaxID=2775498 RepID=UPI002583D423|nr:MAG: hypothetical protein MjAS7_2450 [Metallosphaera javensis (ex Sakai et al. 2022)]